MAIQELDEELSSSPRSMVIDGISVPIDDGLVASGLEYEYYSTLAGDLTEVPEDEPYQVQYKRIHLTRREWFATRLLVILLWAIDLVFTVWLLWPSHWPSLWGWNWLSFLHGGMIAGSGLMQLLLLCNVLTVGRACLAARDPVPVKPQKGLRVAFVTTIVPGDEPVEMALRTVGAGKKIV